MTKANNKQLQSNDSKVIIFWSLIIGITVLFAILFAIRISELRTFKTYEDIERANLDLHYDLASAKGEYYVYVYSTKEDENGKLVDSGKTDIAKANDVFPVIMNYFNYVRRNERLNKDKDDFFKIYGYDVKNNSKDSVFTILEQYYIDISKLPILVLVDADSTGISDVKISTKDIQEELSEIMNKK